MDSVPTWYLLRFMNRELIGSCSHRQLQFYEPTNRRRSLHFCTFCAPKPAGSKKAARSQQKVRDAKDSQPASNPGRAAAAALDAKFMRGSSLQRRGRRQRAQKRARTHTGPFRTACYCCCGDSERERERANNGKPTGNKQTESRASERRLLSALAHQLRRQKDA